MTAIYYLWLRELKRQVRLKVQIVSSLVQPLVYLLALGYGLSPVFRKSGEGNYLDFITPGIVTMTLIVSSMYAGGQLIWERQFGFLKEMIVAPVPRAVIMVGRTSGTATAAFAQAMLVLLFSTLVGFRPASLSGLPLAIGFIALIAGVLTAVGTIIGATVRDTQTHSMIMNLTVNPLFFLSGALFPLEDLPSGLGALTVLDPLSYGVDGLRGALTSRWHFGQTTDMVVMCGLLVFLTWFGAHKFSRIRL